MMYYHTGYWLFGLLFWAGVIALIGYVLMKSRGSCQQGSHSALEVAKMRYAKGELTRKQYDEMRAMLLK